MKDINRIFWKVARNKYFPDKIAQLIIHTKLKGLKGLKNTLKHRKIKEATEEPTYIDDIEYDNLIIIDACRHDLYKETINENTGHIISPASSSEEFIAKTFKDGSYKDNIMVTANPFFLGDKFEEKCGRKYEDVFYETFNLVEGDAQWDEELSTVRPEKVREAAETMNKLYRNKKMIVWFLQPHHPFIGEKFNTDFDGVDREFYDIEHVWSKAEKGKIGRKKVWEGYKENLELVMEEVYKLEEKLDGRTVVISDHGNLFGEKGLYGHPTMVNAEGLRKVPFDVISDDS